MILRGVLAATLGLAGACAPDRNSVLPDQSLPEPLRNEVSALAADRVIVHDRGLTAAARTRARARAILDEADRAVSLYRAWFPEASETPALVIVEASDDTWRSWTGQLGLRPDGIALHARGVLILKEDEEQARRPDRLAHELVHALLDARFDAPVPLWLDEGWAGFYGWELVHALEDGERRWVRRQPAAEAVDPIPLDDLAAIDAYPGDPALARMFYRQCEELIRALDEELGRTAMARFLDMAVREPLPPSRLLVERWGWHAERVRELERRTDERCRVERVLP